MSHLGNMTGIHPTPPISSKHAFQDTIFQITLPPNTTARRSAHRVHFSKTRKTLSHTIDAQLQTQTGTVK